MKTFRLNHRTKPDAHAKMVVLVVNASCLIEKENSMKTSSLGPNIEPDAQADKVVLDSECFSV